MKKLNKNLIAGCIVTATFTLFCSVSSFAHFDPNSIPDPALRAKAIEMMMLNEHEHEETEPVQNEPVVFENLRSYVLPTSERDDAEFLGWNTMEDGSGVMYQPGDVFNVPDGANCELFGIWRELEAAEKAETEETEEETEEVDSDAPEEFVEKIIEEQVATEDYEDNAEADLPENEPETEPEPEQEQNIVQESLSDAYNIFGNCMNVIVKDTCDNVVTPDVFSGAKQAVIGETGYPELYFTAPAGYTLPESFEFCLMKQNGFGGFDQVSEMFKVYTDGLEHDEDKLQVYESDIFETEETDNNIFADVQELNIFAENEVSGNIFAEQSVVFEETDIVADNDEPVFFWDAQYNCLVIISDELPVFDTVAVYAEGVAVVNNTEIEGNAVIANDQNNIFNNTEEDINIFEYNEIPATQEKEVQGNNNEPESIPVWTTAPETQPADVNEFSIFNIF